MIIDLTTKINREQLDQWLEKSEQKHIDSGHIGTHLDTYQKTSIPLVYFKSTGFLIDVAANAENREIAVSDVEHIDITPNSFVLFRTARIDRHPYGSVGYFKDHPQLAQELIDWLLRRNIRFIGIDCAGIRRGGEHGPADIRCENSGVYVIENLCNLEQIQAAKFTVYTMWLDDPELTGLKCRVIAEI